MLAVLLAPHRAPRMNEEHLIQLSYLDGRICFHVLEGESSFDAINPLCKIMLKQGTWDEVREWKSISTGELLRNRNLYEKVVWDLKL